MIQPLRRAHQWIVMGLALVLPTIFVAGLSVREPVPALSESLPGRRSSTGSAKAMPFHEVLAPDVLVYWSEVAPSDASLPPDARLVGSLHLIQSLEGTPFPGGYFLAYSLADRRVVANEPVNREAGQP